MKRRPSPGVVAAVSMAVRRQSRSNCIRRSVDSANANRASTESKDTPPIGRVSASCPMICPSASLTMGWNTARTPDSVMSREISSTPLRLHPRALDQAVQHGLRHRLLDGPLAAHDGIVVDARVPGGEVEGAQHARGGSGLDAAAQRGEQAVAAGGAGRFAPGHEDEEPVRAHRVQADDVLGGQLPARAQGGEHGRELAHGAVVGGPAELGLLSARASEVDVDRRPPYPSTPGCGARPRPPRAARAGR